MPQWKQCDITAISSTPPPSPPPSSPPPHLMILWKWVQLISLFLLFQMSQCFHTNSIANIVIFTVFQDGIRKKQLPPYILLKTATECWKRYQNGWKFHNACILTCWIQIYHYQCSNLTCLGANWRWPPKLPFFFFKFVLISSPVSFSCDQFCILLHLIHVPLLQT